MTEDTAEYNPLDYDNLTRNLVRELLSRGPFPLPPISSFTRAGVYALFYSGDYPLYSGVSSSSADHPIYVGKAVPVGARTGGSGRAAGKPLYGRLVEHSRSLSAVTNLRLDDFQCRFLVVTPLWITMAERFLIEDFQPIWNVCLDGFGNHAPGKGRAQGEISWWDALHPGRPWAPLLRQTRSASDAEDRVRTFLNQQRTNPAEARRLAEVAAERASTEAD